MNFEQLIQTISETHDYLQKKAVASVNQSLTLRNWLFGFYIVEYEQNGKDRAKYGKQLMETVSKKLHHKGIKNASVTNLRLYRQFYQTYPRIHQTVSDELLKGLPKKIVSNKKAIAASSDKYYGVSAELLLNRLSFSHIVELIQEEEPLKRAFYEIQAIKGNWSVRELERQRGSLLYERTGLSRNKEKMMQMANEKAVQLLPGDIIRDPYVFEFLGLKEQEVLPEGELEKRLLDHLQQFLLELGKGFCFEYRQKRILMDNKYYRIDLVFYHRILKCHVLIDLKTGKFDHADAGQMNVYLNHHIDNEMAEGDNPPIGIILCTDKDHSLVKYATAGIDSRLFVSKYKVALPSEEELQKEIEKEKRLLKK